MVFVIISDITKDGPKPIKEIEVDDEVYSENPETGESGLKKVKSVFINESDTLIHLYVDNQEIKTTSDHPFWVVGKGWVGASDLRIEDKVLLLSGETVEINKIKIEKLERSVKVYNFEVDDWHTYFVSKSNVLVHNTCGMNNLRTLNNTIIKGYKVSIDLERGGSGLINIHLKVGDVKYFYKSGKFINNVGKEIPKALRDNTTIKKSLNKALEALKRGW